MLRPRIIPCLLIRDGRLIKTVQFANSKYVGDPLNAVRIFNEKEVDELIVLDVGATAQRREPDYTLIGKLAAECRMPLCYGGGVTTVEQFQRIVSLGVEKVAVGAAAVKAPELITEASRKVGRQSVVVVLDVKQSGRHGYHVYIRNATEATGLDPVTCALDAERRGAGEIVINSIDRDGSMKGYDIALIREIRGAVTLPVTALGGAGSLADMEALLRQFGTIGAAAGSLFVFKGVYRAVLISYPDHDVKEGLFAAAGRPA